MLFSYEYWLWLSPACNYRPLIRIIGDRFPWQVKSAILSTLSIIIRKSGMALKPFLPQLQTTFVKCLQDSTRLALNILRCYSLTYVHSLILRFFYVVYDYDILCFEVIIYSLMFRLWNLRNYYVTWITFECLLSLFTCSNHGGMPLLVLIIT